MVILTNPNPILRRKSTAIESFDDDLRKVAQEMIDVCLKKDGLGLAAPQIGRNIRLFVVNREPDRQVKKGEKPEFLVVVNPRINWQSSDRSIEYEGCLSIPGFTGRVERPNRIRLKFQDLTGQKMSIKASRLLARAIQHENDHLDGILYIDRLKSKRDLIKIDKSPLI